MNEADSSKTSIRLMLAAAVLGYLVTIAFVWIRFPFSCPLWLGFLLSFPTTYFATEDVPLRVVPLVLAPLNAVIWAGAIWVIRRMVVWGKRWSGLTVNRK